MHATRTRAGETSRRPACHELAAAGSTRAVGCGAQGVWGQFRECELEHALAQGMTRLQELREEASVGVLLLGDGEALQDVRGFR
jgi:hypothetical protein